ncbi:MAG: xanthine dehydrogenase family protein molybdopterin-binding subunit, partial [Acidimicrobiaceae bacterium]|nr:xanthine dehydrogenase family protein molybdopterin-binding subunit [Acidimicrobiaceae bacterium]
FFFDWESYVIYTNGAYAGPGGLLGAMTVFESYKIPNFEVEALDVVINTARSAAYRAPAAPLTAYAIETMLDEVAEELGIDAMDLRLKNAVAEGDPSTMGFPFARIGFVECLEAVRDHPHFSAPLGPNQGRGLAAGYWFNIGESSSATVNLNEDGTATVVTGSPDIGGSRASMALMAAEELGIDPHDIRPVVGDTEAVGFTDITEGSRATFATGMAVVEACRKMVVELRGRAAKMMGADVDDVDWVDGQAVYTGSDGDKDPLSMAAICAKAKRTGGPLTATGSLEAHGAGPGFAVHLCDVEVDQETGVVRVVRYTASQDAGTAIHPSYVEGQIQGGVAQGVGWALNEEYIYDSDGVMENPSFLDYRVPVASDLPMIEAIIVEVPNPAHPYGVRGVGETGIVPPIPAVANAIYDATGCRLRDLPMSPIRVLEAITANGGSNGS